MPQGNTLKVSQQPQRLIDTTPIENLKGLNSTPKDYKMLTATDKFNSSPSLKFCS